MEDINIELIELSKVYPKSAGDFLFSLIMATIGRATFKQSAKPALSHLSLKINKGERLGVIGQNGAGKSTLLQIIAGIIEPSVGKIKINGKVKAILTLGIGLRDDLTGRENIYLDGKAQGKNNNQIEYDINKIIDFTELGKYIDFPVRSYSTGMKSRLAFAIATEIKPEILIIDETLSVGDAAFSEKSKKRISQLCAAGSIVIIVSHDMKLIRELCNRCVWLEHGKMIMDGSPELITNSYIEKIRNNDDIEYNKRFQNLIICKSFLDGYSLGELKISSLGEDTKRIISGAPISITCKLLQNNQKINSFFKLICKRLDEVIICEHVANLEKFSDKKNLSFTFPRFNLSQGFYHFELFWIDSVGNKLAVSTSILEVTSSNDLEGGRPVLLDVGITECAPDRERIT